MYCLISLFNNDYTLLLKNLATHLQRILPFISYVQENFTHGGNSVKNICISNKATVMAQYVTMLITLMLRKTSKFGSLFIQFIQHLHTGATTVITVNAHNTLPIDLFHGTCQGYPLCPLLLHRHYCLIYKFIYVLSISSSPMLQTKMATKDFFLCEIYKEFFYLCPRRPDIPSST